MPAGLDVDAWCGRCGERFRLVEAAEPPYAGRCPRCGVAFAPDYTTVLVAAVRRLAAAAATLEATGRELADVAPRLHVDTTRLAADVRDALDH